MPRGRNLIVTHPRRYSSHINFETGEFDVVDNIDNSVVSSWDKRWKAAGTALWLNNAEDGKRSLEEHGMSVTKYMRQRGKNQGGGS